MSRARRRAPALPAVDEDAVLAEPAAPSGAVGDIIRVLEQLEAEVEERIRGILSAAEDSIVSLKNESKRLLITIPKKVRDMPVAEFEKQYPDDFKSGALEEIRTRYAALAAEAAKPVPATGRATAAKRGRTEAPTVLRTVRPRRGVAALAPPPKFNEEPAAATAPAPSAEAAMTETTSRRGTRARTGQQPAAVIEEEAGPSQPAAEPPTGRRGAAARARAAAPASFNGLPLQTPMPFAGEAIPLPVTMLTQKRGGRTRGAGAAPDAAIITTADGKQWAVGKDLATIPESHRGEVEGLLTAQFEFIAAALGKTVFSRGGRR